MGPDRSGDPVPILLSPYLDRVRVYAGNGLSQNQNQTIRSYPSLPTIIERAARWLITMEAELDATFMIRTHDLYWELIHAWDDWAREIPFFYSTRSSLAEVLLEDGAPSAEEDASLKALQFKREPLLPFQEFTAAMTIARRIGLLAGHGRIGLSPEARLALARMRKGE